MHAFAHPLTSSRLLFIVLPILRLSVCIVHARACCATSGKPGLQRLMLTCYIVPGAAGHCASCALCCGAYKHATHGARACLHARCLTAHTSPLEAAFLTMYALLL